MRRRAGGAPAQAAARGDIRIFIWVMRAARALLQWLATAVRAWGASLPASTATSSSQVAPVRGRFHL